MAKNSAAFDIEVDENALDTEWVRHPRLYHQYCVKLADAKWRQDQAKAELELVEAELDKMIRKNPGDFGLEKVTEKSIEKCIPTEEEYLEKYQELINAKHTTQVLQAAVNALETKKSALENLVKLRLADYYSEPRADAEDREAVDHLEKEAIRRKKKRRRDDD